MSQIPSTGQRRERTVLSYQPCFMDMCHRLLMKLQLIHYKSSEATQQHTENHTKNILQSLNTKTNTHTHNAIVLYQYYTQTHTHPHTLATCHTQMQPVDPMVYFCPDRCGSRGAINMEEAAKVAHNPEGKDWNLLYKIPFCLRLCS